MGEAYFYHLTESPLERTLPTLLAKAVSAGWRVLVRGTDIKQLERLDAQLWEDGFLPHGLAGGPHDADQPVVLGEYTPLEGFTCLMSIHGADVAPAEVGLAERVCILFDGHDPTALDQARAQWANLTETGCKAQYWAQEDGRWVKKADR